MSAVLTRENRSVNDGRDMIKILLVTDDMEKDFVYEALRKNNWNRSVTAAQMGIHPTTLWRKIKRLNLEIPKQDGRTRKQ